jgi:hypothetical protein
VAPVSFVALWCATRHSSLATTSFIHEKFLANRADHSFQPARLSPRHRDSRANPTRSCANPRELHSLSFLRPHTLQNVANNAAQTLFVAQASACALFRTSTPHSHPALPSVAPVSFVALWCATRHSSLATTSFIHEKFLANRADHSFQPARLSPRHRDSRRSTIKFLPRLEAEISPRASTLKHKATPT